MEIMIFTPSITLQLGWGDEKGARSAWLIETHGAHVPAHAGRTLTISLKRKEEDSDQRLQSAFTISQHSSVVHKKTMLLQVLINRKD